MQGHSFKKGGYVAMASVGAGMNINCLIYKKRMIQKNLPLCFRHYPDTRIICISGRKKT